MLKEPSEVEEPSEREEAFHLDHDRKSVEGSPDLAPTIFIKIDRAAVFIADVTVWPGERPMSANSARGARPKKLINSNVAIEYGFALRALTDARILMIQNVHYGDRDELPFDLEHEAGPIRFRLAPDATKAVIDAEHVRLRAVLVDALRPFIGTAASADAAVSFEEFPSTTNIAFYWDPAEALASRESGVLRAFGRRDEEDAIEYRFNETPAFYLRLIPTVPLPEPLEATTLQDIVGRGRVDVLTRTAFGSVPARNRFGSIAYEPYGASTTPTAFTQLFRNGEIWGVTRELVGRFHNEPSVQMTNVQDIYGRVLKSFISVAEEEVGVAPPFQIEMGAVGLKGLRVSLPQSHRRWFHELSEPIIENQLQFRKVLNDTSVSAQEALVHDFIERLCRLASITL